MIRKLRLKFIASALASVLITLVLLMGAINIYNYRTIAHNADQILYILKENHGVFPDLDDPFGTMHKPDDYSKETRFESRYFMVEMDTAVRLVYYFWIVIEVCIIFIISLSPVLWFL